MEHYSIEGWNTKLSTALRCWWDHGDHSMVRYELHHMPSHHYCEMHQHLQWPANLILHNIVM